MAKEYTEIGQVREGEYGFYLKVNKSVSLKEGENLSLQKPTDKLDRFLEKGFIDEAEYEEKVEKIPDYIRYNVVLVREK